ncbi:FadR family transcriptional regulator [Candidatus Sumerlaeota bacterium]|nr:FadR family transcriptional regulator [Candidatus Sumerlaeota bacterium]
MHGDDSNPTTPDTVRSRSRGTAVNDVVDWLAAYMAENGCGVGSPLPTEAEICRETGVSRNSVREATSYLRALGIVESRPRIGMRLVRDPGLLGLHRLLTCDRLPSGQFRDVAAFRDALELGMAEEVCAHITPDEIERLQNILDEIERSADDIVRQFGLDMEFHTLYLQASRNSVVHVMSHIVAPLFSFKEEHYVASIPGPLECLEVHRRIVRALGERNHPELVEALLEHIRTASSPHYRRP